MASRHIYSSEEESEESYGSIGPPPSPPSNQEGILQYERDCQRWEMLRNRTLIDASEGGFEGDEPLALAMNFFKVELQKPPQDRIFRFGDSSKYREDFQKGMTNLHEASYKFKWPEQKQNKTKLTNYIKRKLLGEFIKEVPEAVDELRASSKKEVEDLKEELKSVKKAKKAAREELRAAKEELRAAKEKRSELREKLRAAEEELEKLRAHVPSAQEAIPDQHVTKYLSPESQAAIKSGGSIMKTKLRIDGVGEIDGKRYGFSGHENAAATTTPSPPRLQIERLPTTNKKRHDSDSE